MYLPKKAETKTQGVKSIYLRAMSEETPVGLWEMAKEDLSKFKTKGGKKVKGIISTRRSRRRRDLSLASAPSGSG
jgi:hypothetical protein